MIFGSQSISAYTRLNMSVWMILAFQAGLLNIGGFMACHSFVSHVTGFATLFGIEAGGGNYLHAIGLLLVPLFFLLGAMISAFLVDVRLKMGRKPKYYIVFGVIFFLILVVEIAGFNGAWGKFGEPLAFTRDYVLLSLLCMICGVQNATVSLVSRSVVRTTHLTGITTDLGIGLMRVFYRRKIPEYRASNEAQANWMRIGIITFFVLGSAAGYQWFRNWEFRGFIFPTVIAGLLFFSALYFQVIRRPDRL
ncbi:MAG TPA: YoaK family protein [Bdellovibrionales bacterium]|nr:YoaK family protein [Bdellovibrionales bacterium]